MVFSFNPSTRAVLEQVVRQPEFKALTRLPLFAPMEILIGLGAFALFALGTGLYIAGEIPLLLMWAMNAIAIYASFTPLHDATHRSVSRNRTLNDLIGSICCLLLLPGITTRIYRYLHLEHHRFAGDALRDPDEPFVSASPVALPFILAGLDVHWSLWYIRHWHSRPAGERREFVACFTFYIGLHVLMLLSPYALEFFLCFMVPQRLGLFLVAWFFAHIQHPEGVEWESAPFQTTVLVRTNALGRCLLLGQSYHCLHHLAPSIPFYRYERAWRLGAHWFEQQNVPSRTLWQQSQDLLLPETQVTPQPRFLARLAASRQVASGVREFELVPADGSVWPGFQPGAHIDVELPQGVTRQYSLCNDPTDEQRYCIAVKHEVNGRGGSRWLHTQAQTGDTLEIGAPRNNFVLRQDAEHYVLLGCGIGVTPLFPMAYELHKRQQSFDFHIFANSVSDVAFHEQIAGLPFAKRVVLHCEEMPHVARIAQVNSLIAYQPGAQLYLCGPPSFMTSVVEVLGSNRWPVQHIYSESFVAATPVATENRPFEVQIASTGEVLQVSESAFLIDVLHEHGYAVACSCTQGICGSCITPVLEGVPEHRDAIMSARQRDANRSMTVCVSRARSQRLVLDL